MSRRAVLIAGYKQACELELQALKPGNVSIYHDGHAMTVEDFRASYRASSKPITEPSYSLGEKVYYAVKATRDTVGCNTNLGIVLLCAPIIHAAFGLRAGETLEQTLRQTLAHTTREDADWVFRAIRLASPGGLGEASDQDVMQKPSVTLVEAMRLSSHKDRIAYQYISNYSDIFQSMVMVYNASLNRFRSHEWAVVTVFVELLTRYPDSHIERKFGSRFSLWIAAQMRTIQQSLAKTTTPASLLPMLSRIDESFKAKGINPGTSADLSVVTALVVLLEQQFE